MSDHETECPFSAEELAEYEQEVRRRVRECDSAMFRNRSEWHAAIILREFVRAARQSVSILCGHLNKAVYGALWPDFEAALDRGVQVRVVIERGEASAQEVAEKLAERGAFRSLGVETGLPHFALIDGIRYRAELKEADKDALVCACAKEQVQLLTVARMSFWADELWKIAGTEEA